jgi:hypothetical protein
MMMMFFWVLASRRLVGRFQRFGEHTPSIFMADVAIMGRGGIYMGLEEGRLREWANQRRGVRGRRSLMVPLFQPPFFQTYINPSNSQHRRFSPEDGDSVLLRNVGIYRTSLHGAKTQKNNIIILTAVKTSNLTI